MSVPAIVQRNQETLAGLLSVPAAREPSAPAAIDTVDAANPITLGVLLDGKVQERWVLEALQLALEVPGVRLTRVAVAKTRQRMKLATVLHGALDGIDRRLRCSGERLFEPVDVLAQLQVPAHDVPLAEADDRWFPDDAGLAALKDGGVDVWICFMSVPPKQPLPGVSRFGVWGIEVGNAVTASSRWAGASEVGNRCAVTSVSIVDYTTSGGGVVCRTHGATIVNSARNNRLQSLRLSLSFFNRLLTRLREGRTLCEPSASGSNSGTRTAGPRKSGTRSSGPQMSGTPTSSPTSPTVAAVARLSCRLIANVAANRWRLLHSTDQWQIAYQFAEVDTLDNRRLRYLVPPADRFWADPFAIEHLGRFFIFFEELEYRRQKGSILVTEVFQHGEPTAPRIVLERPYHLSYPFIFTWQGSYYLIPESAENGTVELYCCESFPLRWRLHKVLLQDIEAFDCTLWQQENRWWMFVTVAAPGTAGNDELHLYASDTPLGPWLPHRGNPVVTDVRCARPAGPLFVRDGVLYRPSQDSSRAYGHSVQINRVEVLDDDDYREVPVRRIAPDWRRDIRRIHTWSGTNRLRVIDYSVRRPRWRRS